TKVLNVGDDALKLEALAVASKVLNTFRCVLQVTVFLAGLFMFWWQLRRAAPSSLAATLGLALVLGSVAHLLVTNRLLGLALIAVVPVAILGAIAYVARNYWLGRRQDSVSDAGGIEPTPSPGGSPGMGPAVAAAL